MQTVVVVARIKSGMEKEFETRIATLFESVATEPGCRGLTWGRTGNPSEYALVERYADQSALDAHYASSHMAEQGAALGAVFDGAPLNVNFTERGDLATA